MMHNPYRNSEDKLSNWEVNKFKKLLVDVEESKMRKCNKRDIIF